MSILCDFSAIVVASAMTSIKQKVELNEDLIRHITLNNIRSARKKFYKKFGEIVICLDSHHYWRKKIFPYYKASRKMARKESFVDWNRLYQIVDIIKSEIRDNFPYKMIEVAETEADDIISTICQNEIGPHIIISNDKDFLQLLMISGVEIYSPKISGMIKCANPQSALIEHIIKGDVGDGIPNILSDSDTFVTKKRQNVIRSNKLQEWLTSVPENIFDERTLNNYKRNENLISLFKIPPDIKENIWQTYQSTEVKGKRGMPLMHYFMEKNLRNLIEDIDKF